MFSPSHCQFFNITMWLRKISASLASSYEHRPALLVSNPRSRLTEQDAAKLIFQSLLLWRNKLWMELSRCTRSGE